MFFQKQHYESIVPEKSGINRFSATHNVDLFSPIAMQRYFTFAALWWTSQLAEGRTSVKQQVKVPGARHYHFIVPVRLTNGFSRIHHVIY